jgi:hypothetical protein
MRKTREILPQHSSELTRLCSRELIHAMIRDRRYMVVAPEHQLHLCRRVSPHRLCRVVTLVASETRQLVAAGTGSAAEARPVSRPRSAEERGQP